MRSVVPPWRKGGLDISEVTLPEVLARAGYQHRGIFGKGIIYLALKNVPPVGYNGDMEKEQKRNIKAPGKSNRNGISLLELGALFPDEKSAARWFEETYWPNRRCCGRCGSLNTREVKNRQPMPYWCKDCRKYFSVRTGTALESSRLPLRKWAFAVYIYVTCLKSVSSMKLSRDLKVTQKTAWFMLHRLREAWDGSGIEPLAGPVEAD